MSTNSIAGVDCLKCSVLELSTLLCKAVLEMYDANRVLLPTSTITKVARKQVQHVVSSLVPNEGSNRQLRKTNSKRSSEVVSHDGSPFSRIDQGNTPNPSLLETPTSLGAVLGYENKRYRPMPPLPVASTMYTNEYSVCFATHLFELWMIRTNTLV